MLQTFCVYYRCPNSYTEAYGADTINCDDCGCTADLCCEKEVCFNA